MQHRSHSSPSLSPRRSQGPVLRPLNRIRDGIADRRDRVVRRAHDLMFRRIHGSRLIYNTCWEDPRIDRQLLQLDSSSRLVMLTSAGCNALDYALDNPAEIHSVDLNSRQNALLELKLGMFRGSNFEDLYALFGDGGAPDYDRIYAKMRHVLAPEVAEFWDDHIRWFNTGRGRRRSFYYHAASGDIAYVLRRCLERKPGLREDFDHLMMAPSLTAQRRVWTRIEPRLCGAVNRWMARHPVALAMLGVPRPQIELITGEVDGGTEDFIRSTLGYVATEIPALDNYFWRVYITGSYAPFCCPEYLKVGNFEALRTAATEGRVKTHTNSIAGFLEANPGKYTHFVLLDHMDWLAWHDPEGLSHEWDLIFRNAAPGARVLFRSASISSDFLPEDVQRRLKLRPDLTEPLHKLDRVGTYGSTHLAILD